MKYDNTAIRKTANQIHAYEIPAAKTAQKRRCRNRGIECMKNGSEDWIAATNENKQPPNGNCLI